MSDLERFGYFVRELREKAGLTQDELARKVGTSRPTITSIERGYRRYIPTHLVIKLGAGLGVPPGTLLAELGITPSESSAMTFAWLAEELDDPNRRRLAAIGIALLTEQRRPPQTEPPATGRRAPSHG